MDMVAFFLRKDKKAEKKRQRGTTRHHREAIANGGTNHDGNVIRVPKKAHGFYHAFFGIKSPLNIVRYLNRYWLPLRVTVVSIPTNRLPEVLAELLQRGIIETSDPAYFGVTEDHFRHHGAESGKLLKIERPE